MFSNSAYNSRKRLGRPQFRLFGIAAASNNAPYIISPLMFSKTGEFNFPPQDQYEKNARFFGSFALCFKSVCTLCGPRLADRYYLLFSIFACSVEKLIYLINLLFLLIAPGEACVFSATYFYSIAHFAYWSPYQYKRTGILLIFFLRFKRF